MFVVDLIGGIGRRARNTGAAGVVAVRMSGAVLRAGASLPRAALGQWWGAFARQIQFTAWDALTLVSVLAVLCGAIIIGEANAQAVRLGLADTIGRIVVAGGGREIARAPSAKRMRSTRWEWISCSTTYCRVWWVWRSRPWR